MTTVDTSTSSTPHIRPSPVATVPRHLFLNLNIAVTGGTSGLGLALVRELVGRGARVAFVARTRDAVRRVASEHPAAHGIVGDVANAKDIYPMAVQIIGALGKLDVIVNNASDLGPSPLALLADTACEDFERALATNVLGPFRLTKALLGSLASSARERSGAAVINVSSDAALNAVPGMGRVRCQQGRPPSPDPDLARGAGERGHQRAVVRPGRHGHATPCRRSA